MKHLIDDRSRASQRLISEKYGRYGLHGADSVVIDNFSDLGMLYPLCRLIPLVVIHQNHRFSLCSQKVPAGDHSDISAALVSYRKISMALAGHDFFYLVYVIGIFKGNQMLSSHEKACRDALVDQSGRGKSVIRRNHHQTFALFSQLPYGQRNLGSLAHDETCRFHFYGA